MYIQPRPMLQVLVGSINAHDVPTTTNAVELMSKEGNLPLTGTSTGPQGAKDVIKALPLCTVA